MLLLKKRANSINNISALFIGYTHVLKCEMQAMQKQLFMCEDFNLTKGKFDGSGLYSYGQ
jgi:hypothetical protein